MAGIIANVDGDIQKLRQLKNEIDDVKKALSTIDVNVKIDIKEELQKRLQDLTSEYTKLGEKVSQTEAIINHSAERMLKSVDTIAKAQEKLAQSAKSMPQGEAKPQSGKTTSTVSNNTESIHQQSKAYDDLKAQIDGVIGTRMQNVRRMTEEMNAIRLINEEIKKINKSTQYGGELSATQQRRLVMLNDSLLEHKAALADVRQGLNNNMKLDIAAATSMNEMSQSLSRMRIAYRELSEQERNSPFGKELLASIQQADVRIKELDSSIGNNQRNVGNYKSGFNGLNMSVQQVVRELPSASLGLNMFFLAISNNIPIMTDEIKRAKVANEALKASGETTTPVWKQLTSAFFSWQTAMMVGITLLTVYGKDIQKWCSSLFSAKDAINAAAFAQSELHAASLQGQKDAVSEQVKLKTLYKLSQDHKQSINDRTLAVKEMQKEYPSYFGNLSTEAILAGQASDKYKQLAVDILNAAKARAYEKRIEDLTNKNIDIKRALNADTNWTKARTNLYNKRVAPSKKQNVSNESVNLGVDQAFIETVNVGSDPIVQEYDRRNKKIKENTGLLKANNAAINALAAEAVKNETSALKIEKQKNGKPKKTHDNTNSITNANDRLDSQDEKTANLRTKLDKETEEKVEKARIDAMEDGAEKTKALRDYNNKKELDDIEKQKNEYIKQITESEKAKFQAEENAKLAKNKKYHKRSWNGSSKQANLSIDTSGFDELKTLVTKKQQNDTTKSNLEELDNAKKSWNDYYKAFGTYAEKRKALESELQLKIKEIDKDGSKSQDEKNADISKLNKQYADEIDDLDAKVKNSASLMGQLVSDTATMSAKSIDDIIHKVELLIEYLSAAKDAEGNTTIDGKKVSRNDILGMGISSNTLKNLQNSPTEVTNLKGSLDTMRGSLKGKSMTKSLTDEISRALKAGNDEKDASKIEKTTAKIQALGAVFNEYAPSIKDFGNNLSTIFGNDKIGKTVSNVTDGISGIGTTAAGVGQIMSGDVLGGVMNVASGVAKVTSAVEGMFGADYSGYNKLVEEYTKLINVWDELIDRKKEYLSKSYGTETLKTEDEIKNLYDKEIQSYKTLGKARLNSGASAGSHSIGVRQKEGINTESWSELENWKEIENISSSVYDSVSTGRMTGLFDLTAEQLEKLQEDAPTFWAQLDDETKTYLNDIIKAGDSLNDSLDEAKEKLLGMSFDSMYSNFNSMLQNMGSDFSDFSDDIETDLMDAFISNQITANYEKQLSDLYNKWYSDSSASTSDGGSSLTKAEYDSLKSEYETIAQSALDERDYYAQLYGWDTTSSTEATKATTVTASQDSVDETNGRMTAIEEILVDDKGISELSQSELKTLNVQAVVISSDIAGIRDKLSDSYDELKGIHSDTSALIDIIQPIKDMKTGIDNMYKRIKEI
jgi:hypothetical protein